MNSKSSKKKSTMLGPGFRFHPTDEELVQYYLRRKVCGKPLLVDAISEIDVYKSEPWDLPHMSKLKTRDLEWYFFSVLDKKYGNGARTNRATEKGYWKTTGKDRAVHHRTQVVGMKKTLVFHSGRAPKGQRTNWVMHEYRLVDMETAGHAQDAFVLCRVFQKSGTGPKNGEQYGAPFVEEEWDDDELELIPENEAIVEVDFDDDTCLDYHDLQQIFGSDIPSNCAPTSVNFQSADRNNVEKETTESFNNMQTQLLPVGNQYGEPERYIDTTMNNLPSHITDVKPVNEHIGECSNSGNLEDIGFLLNEPFLDSFDILQDVDGGFIEANDLSKPIETDSTTFDMLEEYLTFFDANDNDNPLYFTYDPAIMPQSEDLLSNQTFPQKGEGSQQNILPSGTIIGNLENYDTNAAVLSHKKESANYQLDSELPFIKKASQMLGSTPAPPAFAEEFPSKETVHRLKSALQSSSASFHFTSGMVQIRNLNMDSTSGKHENLDMLLSFSFSRVDDGAPRADSNGSIIPGKTFSAISRGWLCFIFFWVLIFYMSFEIRTYVHAH